MKLFQTLNELINYIPNCLLCNKPMNITISGVLAPVLSLKPRWGSGRENITLKMTLKEGVLRSKHKNHSVAINPEINFIIDGQDLINRFYQEYMYVIKNCTTCHFKITTQHHKDHAKKENVLSPLTLYTEEIRYTLKGGKNVEIYKYYFTGIEDRDKIANISLDGKYLSQSVPWDFSKFIYMLPFYFEINRI